MGAVAAVGYEGWGEDRVGGLGARAAAGEGCEGGGGEHCVDEEEVKVLVEVE